MNEEGPDFFGWDGHSEIFTPPTRFVLWDENKQTTNKKYSM